MMCTDGGIDWNQVAALHGTGPQPGEYWRGGKIAEGSLRDMVKLSEHYEAKGFVGLIILTNGPSYDGRELVDMRARAYT